MKRMFLAVLLLAAATARAELSGSWTGNADEHDAARVQLNMTTRHTHNVGESMDLSDLAGLTAAQINASSATPVQFTLRRDAGTLSFDGTFRKGDGAGHFTFTPNNGYVSQLRALGYTLEPREGRAMDDELFVYAIVDVSIDYVNRMRSEFRDATLHDLFKARAVGVTPQYIREMRAMHVGAETMHDFVKLSAVGVTPQYVRELAAAGYANLNAKELTKLAALGVDADYIRKMSGVK